MHASSTAGGVTTDCVDRAVGGCDLVDDKKGKLLQKVACRCLSHTAAGAGKRILSDEDVAARDPKRSSCPKIEIQISFRQKREPIIQKFIITLNTFAKKTRNVKFRLIIAPAASNALHMKGR
ncbi:hypothetical protein EVAR_40389_1 [Eumeta japonica]|uniref:Uncharacterized protein n=1 Tax=Eumeta variegata TaxID=151549 RepID=A0A4C1WCX0_EUMVA|nr:hypothetical protein EVAR_40389_1 [Eumeta japonica]